MRTQLHKAICNQLPELNSWFEKNSSRLNFPFYSSFDIRHSEKKIVPVDANVYPAGFNNICAADKEHTTALIKNYLSKKHPQVKSNILLLCEEHTNNPYYWENILTLKKLIESAGYKLRLSFPLPIEKPFKVTSLSNETLTISPYYIANKKVLLKNFTPELIICNNDFSQITEPWKEKIITAINPPIEMGWYQRKKSDFFYYYNQFASEFCQIIGFNPETLKIKTERFDNFDINSKESREKLKHKVDQFISPLATGTSAPFVFIKNNSGTYGLGIEKVRSGDDIINWNYKSRKKMKANKGGGGFDDIIIQEGVPTLITSPKETAEISIYTIGSKLSGGFLRAHQNRGPEDNLNSPGAIYKRLCLSDLDISTHNLPEENVYGWIAKIGSLAIGEEIKKHVPTLN